MSETKTAKRRKRKTRAERLESAETSGRVDVLAYKISQRVVEQIEDRYQLPGLWNDLKEEVAKGIAEVLTDKKIDIPSVAHPLLRRFGIIGPNQSGN
ncbi:MAG: hypothetical protein L0Y56_22365 [Nitrospira sp.]|nr:hypothetical protein [Nitrospira sp.]